MLWVIGFLVLLVALLIPILAIVLDSPTLRHIFERRGGTANPEFKTLTDKVAALEDEVDELGRSFQTLREETQFLQRLLENPEQRSSPPSLSPPRP